MRKIEGHDSGQLFAMKVLKKAAVVQKAKTTEHTITERSVLEAVRSCPFIVTLFYAFQTEAKLHLVMGMYLPCIIVLPFHTFSCILNDGKTKLLCIYKS